MRSATRSVTPRDVFRHAGRNLGESATEPNHCRVESGVRVMAGTSGNLSPSAPVRVLHCNETVIVADAGCVCIAIWRGRVTKGPFELQRSGLAEVVQRNRAGAGFLCIVENAAKPPEDTLRRASAEMILSHEERLKCVACVIEGQGFMAAVNRGALAGMVLLLRNRKTEVSIFPRVTEASRWMSQHVGIPPVGEFVETVEGLRSRFPPLAPG